MTTFERCPACPYGRDAAVGTRGGPTSRIVLDGQTPGRNGVEEGRPFVGRAGEVLWDALKEAGVREAEVFVTNSVAYLPNPVRPSVGAIDACRTRLVRDIELHERAVLVARGGTAFRAITRRRSVRVVQSQGKVVGTSWGPLVPTLHPARVLRRPGERDLLVSDLRLVRQIAEGRTG